MPTGYTHAVAEGEVVTLKDFALLCARGMGALITMRDEPFDAPLPEQLLPSTAYYEERLSSLRAELAEVASLSNSEAEARCQVEYDNDVAANDRYRAEKVQKRARYEAMIAQVEAWETEAEGIRDFMLQQLRDSIRFDCTEYEPTMRERLAGDEWRRAKREELAKQIGRAEEGLASEIARTAERNRWLSALRISLPEAPVSAGALQ